MKKTSAGIIIVNEFNEVLMGRVTGSVPVRWDLPKGAMEKNETPVQSAVRECHEEFGIIFAEDVLTDVGRFAYNREKNIHLFYISVKKDMINLESLHCDSQFVNFRGVVTKEIDAYQWVNFSDIEYHCGKSMIKVLTLIGETTNIFKVQD